MCGYRSMGGYEVVENCFGILQLSQTENTGSEDLSGGEGGKLEIKVCGRRIDEGNTMY